VQRIVYAAAKLLLLVCLLVVVCVTTPSIGAEKRSGVLKARAEDMKDVLRLPLYRAPSGKATFAPGRLLVKFRSDVLDAQRKVHLAAEGLTIAEHLALLDVELVSVPVGQELDLAKELGRNPAILYAEPDYLVYVLAQPNDPYYATDQWNMPHISLEGAWDTTTGSGDIVIAVIDSGVDLTHPDLAGKLVAGYDYVNDDSGPSDDNGHGTHVAGISAAATNNSIGVAGVSWGSKIMPVKVFPSDGPANVSDIAQGIHWAADHGADILNLSFGGSAYNTTEANAVNYAYSQGCLVVAAAGNDFEHGNSTSYPAAFDHVLAVGAVGNLNEHADYSNTGFYVDVVAPGGNATSNFDPDPNHWIRSTYWQGSGHSYAGICGTSMACPHVAGLAALLWSVNSALTNDEASYVIMNTATDLGAPGRDDVHGWGVLDANAAVAAAAAGVDMPTPTCSPTITCTPATTWTPTTQAELMAVADTMIMSGAAWMNWGDWDSMKAGSDDYFGNERSLVRFDLSNIPNDAVIQSATFKARYWLCSSGCPNMDASIHRLMWAWGEYDAMWNSMSGASGSIVYDTQQLGGYGDLGRWVEWDITDLVQAWQHGAYPNYGLAIHGQERPPENYKYFGTKEKGAGWEPRLVIQWAYPTATSTPRPTRTCTPTRTKTPTHTLTNTPTSTLTNTPTQTATQTCTLTSTPTTTSTNTPTQTATATMALYPTPHGGWPYKTYLPLASVE